MIRPATRDDCSAIFQFICELADYEKMRHEVNGSVEALEDHLFGDSTYCRALIAEENGAPVGFALFFTTYSTFLCQPGLYLEDLFVAPASRGRGHGKALMVALAKYAVDHGFGRFEWSALDWNEPSINFYKSLGAQEKEGWNVYRLTGPALVSLAEITLK